MDRPIFLITVALLAFATQFLPAASAESPTPSAPRVLLDMGDGVEKRVTPTSDQVTVARSPDLAAPGIAVTIQPGKEGYPGLKLKPEAAPWDLSAFGHVEARVVNTGA